MQQIQSLHQLHYQPLKRQDLVSLGALYQDPLFTKHYGEIERHKQTLNDLNHWFDEYEQMQTELYYSIFSNQTWVGFITLSDFDESASEAWLSIGLQPNVWGQGIGSYVLKAFIKACFDQRNIETIRLSVFSSNERAYCLYLKLGFQVEKIYVKEELPLDFKEDIYQLYLKR